MSVFSRAEAKTILKLSAPLMVSQLMSTMMYVVDTIMAGRVSALDMAAIAVASAIWLPISLILQGLLLALTPIIAQYYGAQKSSEITQTTLQGAWVGVLGALVIFIAMRFIEQPLAHLNMDPELRRKAVDYLQYVSYGIFPAAGYMVLRNFFEGIGITKFSMWIGAIGLMVNIPANYVFIYGHLGMPTLGAAGCGVATALVFLAMFIAMMWFFLASQGAKSYRICPARLGPQPNLIWQILSLGTPIAFALFFEVTLFSCIPLAIAFLGPTVIAAHQIANSYCALVFMLPMSMGLATTIRVGHLVGAQDLSELRKAISTAICLALLLALSIATLTFLARNQIAALYTVDLKVIGMASSIMVLACLYQFSDAIQVVACCALRGLKITKPTFFITFVAYWPIGFGVGWILARTDLLGPARGVYGFWYGIILGLSCAAAGLGYILYRRVKLIDLAHKKLQAQSSSS